MSCLAFSLCMKKEDNRIFFLSPHDSDENVHEDLALYLYSLRAFDQFASLGLRFGFLSSGKRGN